MARKYAGEHGFSSEEIDKYIPYWDDIKREYYIEVPDIPCGNSTITFKLSPGVSVTNIDWCGTEKGEEMASLFGSTNTVTMKAKPPLTVPGDFYKKNSLLTTGVVKMSDDHKTLPNNFVEYKLKVVDISHKDKKDHKRILADIPGTIELSPHSNLKDTVILKHAAELAKIKDIVDGDVAVSVETVGQWGLKAKV